MAEPEPEILDRYNVNSPCAMCGYGPITGSQNPTNFHLTSATYCPTMVTPHLCRTCKRCGYVWAERPLIRES